MEDSELIGQIRKKARKPEKTMPESAGGPSFPPEAPALTPAPKFHERSEFWPIFGPGLVLTILGFLLAYSFVGQPPPKKLRFASGSTWGAYNHYAQQYKELLGAQGLDIEILETHGSTENLELLSRGEADIAFVQGGLLPKDPSVRLEALGSVYYEPLWIFVRSKTIPRELSELKGLRMAIGPVGSGTRSIALEILEDAQMTSEIHSFDTGGEEAESMFLKGELDALFLVGTPTIPVISRMLSAPGVQLMEFARAPALERRHQFLSLIPLYTGVIDLKQNVPPNDVELLAPAATLVVRQDFHKALPGVFLRAAQEIHGNGSILNEYAEFPSSKLCSFPIAGEAKHFYQYGTSFLFRHLPFYLASGLDRMAILLLPFVGLLIPIVRLLPPFYSWTMKRKIYRRYRALQRLEARIGFEPVEQLLGELDVMEEGARRLSSMPAAYSADIYALRTNLERVRIRLKRLDVEEKAAFTPPPEKVQVVPLEATSAPKQRPKKDDDC